MIRDRLQYYRRIGSAYLTHRPSQLTFWHGTPEANPRADTSILGEYYMSFRQKADYPGPFDRRGIPRLDYHGRIGIQYNPIAIAQYGLANYNVFAQTGESVRFEKFRSVADWLVENLEPNPAGLSVWNHDFDWEYRTRLIAPWYSALAQGQGISVLVRAHAQLADGGYLEAAERALESFFHTTDAGGVVSIAGEDCWLEEYIVSPPTHVLNGCIWASWGLYDHWLLTRSRRSKDLFDRVAAALVRNIGQYDAGFWSLYELSGTRLRMLASPFYHALHIVQLGIMSRLTGETSLAEVAERWDGYRRSRTRRMAALAQKAVFKLCYY